MTSSLLPVDWDPKAAGDRVLARLVNVCLPTVKGAHDADFVGLNGKAYIVYMANDLQPSENPAWPFIYCALTVFDLTRGQVDDTVTFAASGMVFARAVLPAGACFVPRILRLDSTTLRCFFASESPGERESQTYYLDYDMVRGAFDRRLNRAWIQTDLGTFPMQPQALFRHAAAKGFALPQKDYGLYPIDSFKTFDGQVHAVLNNFPIGQNAWTVLSDERDRFVVLGDYFEPTDAVLTESAVNRLPGGSWVAVSRQERGDRNYMFTHSADGMHWQPHASLDLIRNGTNSKPTFDRFDGVYYLGWQEATRINGVARSVFNIEVSRDGVAWQRKYRFGSEHSFQYPTFRQAEGGIWLTVTQGDVSESRKERIMVGRLE